jgi:tetratricopeptide (TPR) repeat protein
MAHYRTALRLDPRLAIAHANLAIALAHGGDAAGAIDELLAALRLDPSNASWEYNAGLLLARSGRKAEAVLHLEAAIRLSPASPVAAAARDALRTVQPAR